MAKGSATIDIAALKVAGEGASKYITEIDSNGIKIHAENNVNANYTVINAEGMEIFQGNTETDSISMAKFGTVARIGTLEDANITIDNSSIKGVGISGKEFFVFEDSTSNIAVRKILNVVNNYNLNQFPYYNSSIPYLTFSLDETPKNSSGLILEVTIMSGNKTQAIRTAYWTVGGSGSTQPINMSYTGHNIGNLIVTYDGTTNFTNIYLLNHWTYDNTSTISMNVKYFVDTLAPSFMIGSEHTASGGYSFAEGFGNTASNDYSHAEGYQTTASGTSSHAEGRDTTASNNYSHAEGYETIASGQQSHAEGRTTIASGAHSHAQNLKTTAVANAQTVIGTYNTEDDITSTTHANNLVTFGHYALIVGNGTSDSARSNALTVNWNGNVNASGQYENLYKITTVQKVISGGINANNYVAAANITMTAEPGYNAVGIVGHASNYFRVQPTTNYVVNNTTLFAGFANWSATNVTSDVTVTFYILWLKATAAS